MSTIINLARADRKLAIICHTPTSINNLMHRYDPYKYSETNNDYIVDGSYRSLHHQFKNVKNMNYLHRFKNIETLSIDLEYFNTLTNIKIFNLFRKVKHLSFFDMFDECYFDHDQYNNCNAIQPMSFLETISFTNVNMLQNILYFLKQYKLNVGGVPHSYYNHIIYQLKSIAFIDCDLSDTLQVFYDYDDDLHIFSQYKNIVNFILPSQPNNLQVLKLENTYLAATEHIECKNTDDEFNNLDRIKQSLANLKGFVYAEPNNESNHNLCNILAANIVSNLIAFQYLESLYTHSDKGLDGPAYLNNNNSNALNKVTELCISISMSQNASSPLHSLRRLVPNLEKLCLVIHISDDDKNHTSKFEKTISSILHCETKLKLFQLVMVLKDDGNINDRFCETKIEILADFTKTLVKVLNTIRCYYAHSCKRPLLLKFHVKSSHSKVKPECCIEPILETVLKPFADIIQNLVMNYLIAYPIGKIQFKYSWNVRDHSWLCIQLSHAMVGLDRLFRVRVKRAGTLKHFGKICYSDFKQYAISITQKNIDQSIQYDNKWKVDCRYCCNTPWV